MIGGCTVKPLTPSPDAKTLGQIQTLAYSDASDPRAAVMALVGLENPEDADAWLEKYGPAIDREAERARLTYEILDPRARSYALKVFDRLLAEFDSLDLDEATEHLKHALRVMEAADRLRMHEKDARANYPVLHITMVGGVFEGYTTPASETIDVPVRDVGGGEHG